MRGGVKSTRGLLVFLGVCGAAAVAHGQSAPAQPAYVDRVIEGLPPEPADDPNAYAYDRDGWPRFLRLETRLGTQPFDTSRRARIGYGIYGLLETPNHGSLSIDGTYTPRESSGTLTLRQRGLPLANGWVANHELGVINSPTPSILRLPMRVFLPSAILQGLSAEWESPGNGLQLQASTGEPGRLAFLPASGFEKLPGQRTSVGGQWRLNAQASDPLGLSPQGWTLAMQHEDARGVSNVDLPTVPSELINANSTLLALRKEEADYRIQGQVVNTRASNVSGTRSGFWVDGEWDDGPREHGVGAYRLEPDLTWAQLPLANDIMGTYLRSSWRTRQWSAEGSVDWLRSVSGRAGDGIFATASGRMRLGRGNSVGGGMTVRRFDGNAWSTYGDWRFDNGWGMSGLRLDLAGGATQTVSRQLTWDQEWIVPQGWALSTSFGAGEYDAQASTGLPAETLWSAAVSLSAPLASNASLRGNLNTEHSSGGHRRHSLNLGAIWRIDPRWSLEGNYNRSLGRSRQNISLDPLAPALPTVNPDSDRSFYAVLRYELQAGSRSVPLGGRPADGGGRIAGTVYFDANRSGTQEASETGAPGVTVYLDNRYAVRTDSQGRFEFPFVASGPRTLSVRNDTLPLPWTVVDQGQVKVDVRIRESVNLSIPVQRSE